MRVKPAVPGSVIRDPSTGAPLPEEGARVQDSSYWRRRIRSGDVTVIEGPVVDVAPIAPLTTRGPGAGRRGEE